MKKNQIIITLTITISMVLAIGTYYFLHNKNEDVKESIIFFPLDEKVQFQKANTALTLLSEKDDDEYNLKWSIESDLGQEVYLRQDIGLLFSDGQLIDKTSKWQENANLLKQVKKVTSEDSSHFQAISFHHGEIHYKDDIIKSTQRMSANQLYVIDSPKHPLESFRDASTPSEKEWKNVLDHATIQQLKYSWKNLLKYYNIPVDKYHMIPLTSLHKYNNQPLPGLSMEETKEVIGGLWEGLYKNYFLGLKREDGTTISPIGSIIPLILQNNKDLIILIESKDGEPFQLIQ